MKKIIWKVLVMGYPYDLIQTRHSPIGKFYVFGFEVFRPFFTMHFAFRCHKLK